jgi:hypothetical protein
MAGRIVHVKDNVSDAIYIGRAMPRHGLKASPFANPAKISAALTRVDVVNWYAGYLMYQRPDLLTRLPDIRDKPLACWCRHDGDDRTRINGCHGDVLLDLLAAHTDEELRAMSAS